MMMGEGHVAIGAAKKPNRPLARKNFLSTGRDIRGSGQLGIESWELRDKTMRRLARAVA